MLREPREGRQVILTMSFLVAAAILFLALALFVGLVVKRHLEGPPTHHLEIPLPAPQHSDPARG